MKIKFKESLTRLIKVISIGIIIANVSVVKGQSSDLMSGDFWKLQVMEDILEPWKKYSYDPKDEIFHTYLDKNWQPSGGDEIFPGMIARHLFSFSVGYLISGKEENLFFARKAFNFLVENGWDEEYGGWYYKLAPSGKALSTDKDMFTNAYVITGLAMYYIVTRNLEAKKYLDRSINILEENAWDKDDGGYFRVLNRDLTVQDSNKVFSPQLAPVSGYLLYLYAATKEKIYLEISERILDLTIEKMTDESEKWVLEEFDKTWNPLEPKNEVIDTGHNIEVAWMLMRLYLLTGKERYLQRALNLNKELLKYAFDNKKGRWYKNFQRENPTINSDNTSWWTQAYGNMLQLYLFAHLKQENFLINFKKGANFWNSHFIDSINGGTYTSVDGNGNVVDGSKAGKYKTSYHAVENGLLSMLYLDFWINNRPITLYFFIDTADGEDFFPLPLEENHYKILEVLVNGKNWGEIKEENGSIKLPRKSGYNLVIRLQKPL